MSFNGNQMMDSNASIENKTAFVGITNTDNEQPWYVVLTSTVMCIVILLTMMGNIFVIVSIFTYKPLRTVPNFFIVSLAMADMLVALIVMPFHTSNNIIGNWIYGEVFCKIWLTFDVLLCTASILNLCVIALDRYWAIHDPIRYAQKRTIKRVLIMIFVSWTLSAMISIPPLFGWGDSSTENLYDSKERQCHLTTDRGYVLYSACGSFYIPLCVMSFVYLKIYLATRKRLQQKTKAAAANKRALLQARGKEDSLKERNNSDSANDDNETTTAADINHINIARTGSKKSARPDIRTSTKHHNGRFRNSIHTFFEEKQRISLSKERKAARTLAIIMVTFVLCWIPFFMMYLILPFCESCNHPGIAVEIFFVWLGYLNSTLNPVIYTVFNMEFRKAFNDMTARCFGKAATRRGMPRTYV